ncbi:hypothetical protein [Klebsiella pneumoniae]|uniref:hypothetical protein n=1 Tax=Klebsiella pneumoniae TaxID=573 RepID=UPI0039705345
MFGKLAKWRANTTVKAHRSTSRGQLRTRNWQDDAGVRALRHRGAGRAERHPADARRPP